MSELKTHVTLDCVVKLIDEWHFAAFHGSVVARDTEVWNLVYAEKEVLKQRLAGFLAELPPKADDESDS